MNRSDGRISIIAVKLECATGVKGILDVPIPKIILSKMSSFQQNITKHAKKQSNMAKRNHSRRVQIYTTKDAKSALKIMFRDRHCASTWEACIPFQSAWLES